MKAFIIHLPERPHSVESAHKMLNQLNEYGLDAQLFEGIPGDRAVALAEKAHKTLYPYSIKNKKLSEAEIQEFIKPELYEQFRHKHYYEIIERQRIAEQDKGKLSRPGVIGCFYSHYELWLKCIDLDQPILIFEDDVKFYRGYEPVEFEGVLILSLGKSSFLGEPQRSYLENPVGNAQVRKWQNFSMPGASGYAIKPDAAKALVKFYKPYWYPADNAINQFVVPIQISTHLMGRNTLPEEGNISMTKSKEWT